MSASRRFKLRPVVGVMLALLASHPILEFRVNLVAGEVSLKNGFHLEGKLDPTLGMTKTTAERNHGNVGSPTMLMVHAGFKRYFVSSRQVLERVYGADLSRYQTFELKKRRPGRKSMSSIGSLRGVKPFDQFGHRSVGILTKRGPVEIVQAITDISPKYLRIVSLDYNWELGLATSSIPPNELDAILRHATDQTNPDDRLAISRFYLQAGMNMQAALEVDSIINEFPELKETAEEIALEVRQLIASQLLSELRRRRNAGQHRLAREKIQQFPIERMNETVLRQVRDMSTTYEENTDKIESAIALLGEFQAKLEDPDQVAAVSPLRSIVSEDLDDESLDRLDAFLKLADDESFSPDEKLAFVYSGWILGNNNAIRDLGETVRLWDARFLVGEYLRTENSQERAEMLAELTAIEGVGVDRISQMVPYLSLPLEMQGASPGEATEINIEGDTDDDPIRYSVLLPTDYSPNHLYPLIVSLRPAERTADDMLLWWGGTREKPGQSQRHGYIVIAPEYLTPEQRSYGYNSDAHRIVLHSIRDARKRFNIDSDRVFLTGHGIGGDAAFDMGMSHPDLFAGVIPIAGISRNHCIWYWENAKDLPFYIINGQLDRDSLERNADLGKVDAMIRRGFDVIYCDYVGRGYESFFEEIVQLFDWMELHRRVKYAKKIKMRILRPSENRFFWIQGEGFPPNVSDEVVTIGNKNGRVRPMTFSAEVTPGNTIHIRFTAQQHTLWLSPEFVDFERRVAIRRKGKRRFNDFLTPDIKTLLDDLRTRGDRQKLYTVKIEID